MHQKVSFIQKCPLFRVSFIGGFTVHGVIVTSGVLSCPAVWCWVVATHHIHYVLVSQEAEMCGRAVPLTSDTPDTL